MFKEKGPPFLGDPVIPLKTVRSRASKVLTHSGPSGKFKAGFTDTAGGSADFVQSGFGKHSRPKKAPKVCRLGGRGVPRSWAAWHLGCVVSGTQGRLKRIA